MSGMMALFAALVLSVAPVPEAPFEAPPSCPGCSVGSEEPAVEAGRPALPHCPYGFRSQMPPGVFCVYRGRALDAAGKPCSDEVWAIWSSYTDGSAKEIADESAGRGDVAVGILSQPEMVFRGEADRADSNRAGFQGYFVGDDPKLHPSLGYATLHTTEDVGTSGNRLTMSFTGPDVPRYEGCPLASYEGSLVGVLGEPGQAPPARLVLQSE